MRKEAVSNYAVVPFLNEEERQEEQRVRTVRRFCLPERWFVPAPGTMHVDDPCHGRVLNVPRRGQAYALRGRPGRAPKVIPTRALEPVYENETSTLSLKERIRLFIWVAPGTNVYALYRKAIADDRTTIAMAIPSVLRRMLPRLEKAELAAIRNTFSVEARTSAIARDILAAVS